MGTTTNNGWPTPVATDLVKDGWEAIKDLGDAIDTTLGVYAPSTPGLTLINTTSFSAVASQSFNNVFSSTYDSYKIVTTITFSNQTNLNLRYRTSGSDNSTSNYQFGVFVKAFSSTAFQNDNQSSGATSTPLAYNSTEQSVIFDVLNPFDTRLTKYTSSFVATAAGVGNFYGHSGLFNATTSFDGFTLLAESGTMTGSVSVYGFNK